jgi:hypothetical protein
MQVWLYRIVLFVILFGLSALPYGGNALSPIFDKAMSGMTMIGILSLIIFYFWQPPLYKLAAWLIGLGVIGLLLESKYDYGQFVYSYFVIKRFAFCSLAMLTFVVASRAGELKIQWAVYLIFTFFIINQLFLGQIFSYALTSETRTVNSNETLYLIIPFVYYVAKYMKERRVLHFLLALFTFALIVFLLHRSVISAAVLTIGVIAGLSVMGKLSSSSFPMGRTIGTLTVLIIVLMPVMAMLPGKKINSLVDSISGILDPKEDNTGSWRLEQSEHYLKLIPDKPILGWRYEGYDRGEVMENEDFPQKGTIIHSLYVDMLYNYGAAGLALILLIILGTLLVMYRRNQAFTIEQTVVFCFIISGLIYGISYQLPVYYWGFVGLGMYYALRVPNVQETVMDEEVEFDEYDLSDELTTYKTTQE